MQPSEFINRIKHTGLSQQEAESAIRATLLTLAERLPHEEAKHLAAQLPDELATYLADAPPFDRIDKMSLDAFYRRAADRQECDMDAAKTRVEAVVRVMAEAVTSGQMKQVRHMLPAEFGALFQPAS